MKTYKINKKLFHIAKFKLDQLTQLNQRLDELYWGDAVRGEIDEKFVELMEEIESERIRYSKMMF